VLRIRDILVRIRIRTYGQRIRYLTQDLAPDPGIFFSDQDDNKIFFSKIFCSLLFEATKLVHLCSCGTARTACTQNRAAHIHLLYPSLPRTCLCAESVWWGGCRAPTAARVLQALRTPRVRRTRSSTLLSSRYHLKYLKLFQDVQYI
jgi:hypothetical protein